VRLGLAIVLPGRTEAEATVVADRVNTALLRAVRGGRVAGRRGRTGEAGESLRGAMVRRVKVGDHRSDV
jgi:hypothetical protein